MNLLRTGSHFFGAVGLWHGGYRQGTWLRPLSFIAFPLDFSRWRYPTQHQETTLDSISDHVS